MARASEAREWASKSLRGLADSLFTPFSGKDGDEIDYDAFRALVRYCLGDLDHDGLWLVSGVAEFWSLTMAERKKLAEVAVEEARRVKPSAYLQLCTLGLSAKDTVELTLHAQDLGADICFIQNPIMEAHGGPGMLEFFRYVADRTDIALGMFNTPSSGYEMTPQEVARVADEIPAMCAIKDGAMRPGQSAMVSALAPGKLVILNAGVDTLTTYLSGYLQQGLQGPCIMGGIGYIQETPSDKRFTNWFNLVLDGKLDEARSYFFGANVAGPLEHGLHFTQVPERPGYWTHWGSAVKYCSSLLGLAVGDYPYSRAPQLRLTGNQEERIRSAYVRSGLIDA
jgi:4-hydroxy-tetrahydrodipicolinate synthase